MPRAKEIQRRAIDHVAEIDRFSDIPWESALPELEVLVLAHVKNADTHLPRKEQEVIRLLNHIANNGEFMLALVFSADHQNLTALPLPELFEHRDRVPLVYTQEIKSLNSDAIIESACGVLKNQLFSFINPMGVIMIQQNIGEFRNMYPVSIGLWDSHEAKLHVQGRNYQWWIETTQHDLNRVRAQEIPLPRP